MKNKLFLSFAVVYFGVCAAAFAGPMDNAMEFQEKAVAEAEERNNAPQSSDSPLINWAGDSSDTGGAVNTSEEVSPNTSMSGQ